MSVPPGRGRGLRGRLRGGDSLRGCLGRRFGLCDEMRRMSVDHGVDLLLDLSLDLPQRLIAFAVLANGDFSGMALAIDLLGSLARLLAARLAEEGGTSALR